MGTFLELPRQHLQLGMSLAVVHHSLQQLLKPARSGNRRQSSQLQQLVVQFSRSLRSERQQPQCKQQVFLVVPKLLRHLVCQVFSDLVKRRHRKQVAERFSGDKRLLGRIQVKETFLVEARQPAPLHRSDLQVSSVEILRFQATVLVEAEELLSLDLIPRSQLSVKLQHSAVKRLLVAQQRLEAQNRTCLDNLQLRDSQTVSLNSWGHSKVVEICFQL